MTSEMIEGARWYFVAYYTIGAMVLAINVLPTRIPAHEIEARPPLWRVYGAMLLLPLEWVLPPCLIVWHAGEIAAVWPLVRLAGVALSIYAALFHVWGSATLGRFLVAYPAIFSDHELVTRGPYQFVRHPIYSANLALIVGSALATLNLYVLGVAAISAWGLIAHARFEEEFLRRKFGASYDEYSRRTGLVVPRFIGRPRAVQPEGPRLER